MARDDKVGPEKQPGAGEVHSPFFSADEAARYLRISVRALQNFRIDGGGPAYRKHGARVVYHVDDLDRWSVLRRYRSAGERDVK